MLASRWPVFEVNGLQWFGRIPARTSRTFGKRAGDMNLRIGTLNVGSMKGRSGEVADMAARRRLDFCCLQETRWKGGSVRSHGKEGAMYKFYGQDVKKGWQV